MSVFASNLKFLRNRRKINQEILAIALQLSRSKIAAFENGQIKNPTIDDLLHISEYFQISIDLLLRDDLSSYSESKLMEIETSLEYARGKNLRIVAISIDNKGKENIEYVPLKVKAGYLAGYNDPEFIGSLAKVSLPFLDNGHTMRLFECEGDSMLPLPDKCKILGEYVDDWHKIKDGEIYIVISYKEGFAIKKLKKRLENNSVTLQSLNPIYPEYEMYLRDISEIWRFKMFMSDGVLQTINSQY